MKNYLLLLCLSIPFWMMGQSLKVYNSSNTTDLTGGQTTVSGSYNDNQITVHLKVKNLSSTTTYNVFAKKRIISSIAGTNNDFCFAGQCYTGLVSTTFALMGINSIDSTFSAYYYPFGISGITEIAYTFYPDHGTDTATVRVIYDATSAGVEDNVANINYISAPYPNPASTYTSLNYSLKSGNNAYVTINNILGAEIKRTELTSKNGSVRIVTSDLKSGIYFCSFVADGKVVKTQKFTVAK